MSASSRPESTAWSDRIGVVCSALCAVHCAVGAALPFLLAGTGLVFLLSEEAEWVLVLVAVGVGLFATAVGYARHRRVGVTAFMLLGIATLLLCRVFESESLGPVLSIAAGLLLMCGHALNSRSPHAHRAAP